MSNNPDQSVDILREDLEIELNECLKGYVGQVTESDVLKSINIALKNILTNKFSELVVDVPIDLVKVSIIQDNITIDFTDLMAWFKGRTIC